MIKPMPPYFIVSIPRREQTERKEKIGQIYYHPNYVYMTRGMQCGMIVSIGSEAGVTMPNAALGDTLLFHHFVESTEKTFCVARDPFFNYYVVTCRSHNGQNNQTYGIFKNNKITPHPDYIFLDIPPKKQESTTPEEYLRDQLMQKQNSSLWTFKEWRIDREELQRQMQEIRNQIESLTKPGMIMTAEVKKVIEEKEGEMNRLSKLLHHQRFQLYKISAVHPLFSRMVDEQYGCPINAGDEVYMLNIACETKMEFNRVEYIVAKTQHFGVPLNWVKSQFKKESASL